MTRSNFDSDVVRRSYAHRKMDTPIQVLTNGFHLKKFLHISKFTSKGVYAHLRPYSTIICKVYNLKGNLWRAMLHWSVSSSHSRPLHNARTYFCQSLTSDLFGWALMREALFVVVFKLAAILSTYHCIWTLARCAVRHMLGGCIESYQPKIFAKSS